MRRQLALLFCLLSIAGCVSVPFQKTLDARVAAIDAHAAVEQFKESSPDNFRMLQTITFEYGLLTFSGLGFAEINSTEKAFAVVCMNHMGVKLFEVYGNKDGINAPFVMDELKRGGNIAVAVGEDIKRIYFDLVPAADASIEKEKYRILFRQSSAPGIMEYSFGGIGYSLVEKTYYEENIPVWRVSYYEYQDKNGKLYPGGIVLENYRYSYRLIIRLKEIYS
jgi:hypothetical protein